MKMMKGMTPPNRPKNIATNVQRLADLYSPRSRLRTVNLYSNAVIMKYIAKKIVQVPIKLVENSKEPPNCVGALE